MSQLGVNFIAPTTAANVEIQGINPPTYLGSELAQKSDVVLKSGSTMTGALVLSGDATANLNPVTKQQFDALATIYNTQVLGTTGSQKLLGSVIIKWGVTAIPSGSNTGTATVTFASAFPNGIFVVVGNADKAGNAGWNPVTVFFDTKTTGGFHITADTANNTVNLQSGISVNWIAIGY